MWLGWPSQHNTPHPVCVFICHWLIVGGDKSLGNKLGFENGHCSFLPSALSAVPPQGPVCLGCTLPPCRQHRMGLCNYYLQRKFCLGSLKSCLEQKLNSKYQWGRHTCTFSDGGRGGKCLYHTWRVASLSASPHLSRADGDSGYKSALSPLSHFPRLRG